MNYFKQWDKHILSAGFNMEFRESVTTSRSMSVEGFLNDEMNSLGNGHKYYRDRPSSSDSKSRAVGFTGTINIITIIVISLMRLIVSMGPPLLVLILVSLHFGRWSRMDCK